MKVFFYCILIVSAVSFFTFILKGQSKAEPKDPIVTISLPVSAWEVVLSSLQEKPYKDVSGILNAIVSQANKQLKDTTAAPIPQVKDYKKSPK